MLQDAASKSRRGNCRGNARSKTLFGSLKVERLHGQHVVTRCHSRDEALAWILWYKQTRIHSTQDCISPMQFLQEWLVDQVRQTTR